MPQASADSQEVKRLLGSLGEDRIARLQELISSHIEDDCSICMEGLNQLLSLFFCFLGGLFLHILL